MMSAFEDDQTEDGDKEESSRGGDSVRESQMPVMQRIISGYPNQYHTHRTNDENEELKGSEIQFVYGEQQL